jgi:predicted short-subunit dehydrogenase-like oxidoreductase (DUF2520 family)
MPSKNKLPIRIVLLGSGNLATHLGQGLQKKGLKVVQVYSPQQKHARQLASLLGSAAVSSLKLLDQTADLYIIAVKDDAIASLAKKLKLTDKLVVHTSGSVSLDVLKPASISIGIFYPLQTFTKERAVEWSQIPICLESTNEQGKTLLKKVADLLSNLVVFIDSDQRKRVHLAAVFASNFSNHMYALAEEILSKEKLSFSLLKPLMLETARKASEMGPTKAQTGPAKRKDTKTIRKQTMMLSGQNRQIYSLLSKSIRKK